MPHKHIEFYAFYGIEPSKKHINEQDAPLSNRAHPFCSRLIYDQMVPQEHFLRMLNQIIDWDRFTDRLIELYRGGGEYGRPPFNPIQLLKICLLAYFYDLSERQVEVFVNENMPARYFVGLGLDHRASDHSTLTVFRKRLTRFRDSSLFHCDHIEPETDGQAADGGWVEDTQCFGVVTQGEESMVTENHPKRGEKSKKVQ